MTEERIRDFEGRILAIIQTKDNGDQVILEFPSRKILAEYIKQQDHTIEFPSRRVKYQGNALTRFLPDKK